MIYVPNLEDYECVIVKDSKTIRAYEKMPVEGQNSSYIDYYVNSHYLYKEGIELVSDVPVCIDSSKLTNKEYYRNDFSHILVIFVLLVIICFYIPGRIIMRLFKKRY